MKIREHVGFTAGIDEHKQLRRLLTKEMLKDWHLPAIPRRPRAAWRDGALIGYWRNERLIGGAFIGPLSREADELLARAGMAQHSAYQWLTTRCVVVHDIHTRTEHRREGVASALLDHIAAVAREHDDDYIIAVPTTTAARNLFTQAGYILQEPGVHLGLHRHSGELTGIFPAGPHDTYARYELGHRHEFTLSAHH